MRRSIFGMAEHERNLNRRALERRLGLTGGEWAIPFLAGTIFGVIAAAVLMGVRP